MQKIDLLISDLKGYVLAVINKKKEEEISYESFYMYEVKCLILVLEITNDNKLSIIKP